MAKMLCGRTRTGAQRQLVLGLKLRPERYSMGCRVIYITRASNYWPDFCLSIEALPTGDFNVNRPEMFTKENTLTKSEDGIMKKQENSIKSSFFLPLKDA